MTPLLRKIFFLFLFPLPFIGISQIAVEHWQDHLPYNKAIDIANAKTRVYAATPYALMYIDQKDNSLHKISKANGLSDVGISSIAYSEKANTLVIGYTNGNIDFLIDDNIINLSDIKRKSIYGSKSINNILVIDDKAYLSCGFGIVKIDLSRQEIENTYFIGSEASYLNVYDLTFTNNTLYAATEKGIKYANINDNLPDYKVWSDYYYYPDSTQPVINIETFYASLIIILKKNNTKYVYQLTPADSSFNKIPLISQNLLTINTLNKNFSISYINELDIFDKNLNRIKQITNLHTPSWNWYSIQSNQTILIDDTIWWADNHCGIAKQIDSTTLEKYYVNGPSSADAYDISSAGGNVWVAKGGLNISGGNLWNSAEIYAYLNNTWTTLNKSTDTILNVHDMITVAVNPLNPKEVFTGSWNGGVFQFEGTTCKNRYTEKNSSLEIFYGSDIKVRDLQFDSQGNLWVLNPGVNDPVSVRMTDGTWKHFSYGNISQDLRHFVIDKNDVKWVFLGKGKGLLVFDNGSDPLDESDDHVRHLNIVDEGGGIITNNIYSITADHDGVIWIGTDQGIMTYFHPENVFSEDLFPADRVLIDLGDGTAQYLMKYETVTALAVDGADRKWVGTANSGVFLLSKDGTQEIKHFTAENSPLLSNNVSSIAIDGVSGEVFFVTDKGIISYRSDSTEGEQTFLKDTYVFPNPVKSNYSGLISLIGLVNFAHVTITDIAGNVVYATTAKGGMATWDGKNFDGKKVATGVYLAFCTNDDGSQTKVLKILIVK
jgi:hypothetical protein